MWLIAAILALAAALALHALAGRLALIANSVLRFLAVGTLAGLALVVWTVAAYPMLAAEQLAAVLLYTFACALYIFLFASTLSSVSANLLSRLAVQPLSPEEVAQLYSGRRMTEIRIARMIGAGLLTPTPRGLALTAAGNRTVAAYEALRAFFRHVAEA